MDKPRAIPCPGMYFTRAPPSTIAGRMGSVIYALPDCATKGDSVRSTLTRILAMGTTLAIGISVIAIAHEAPYVSTCLRSISQSDSCSSFPPLVVDFGGEVVPRGLPKREMSPVAIKLWGKVSTNDDTHPSALRETTIDFDRNLAIGAKGLPVCHPGHRDPIERDSIPKACDSSIIGGGKADFELAFPEAPPIRNPSKLTIYNAGVKDGATTLYVVAPIHVPVPRTIVIRVEIERIHAGRYGLQAVVKIPVIAGGSGSLLDFSLELKRLFTYRGMQESFAMAGCPDGHLNAEVSTVFKNEAKTPGVAPTIVAKGTLVIPCTPKG